MEAPRTSLGYTANKGKKITKEKTAKHVNLSGWPLSWLSNNTQSGMLVRCCKFCFWISVLILSPFLESVGKSQLGFSKLKIVLNSLNPWLITMSHFSSIFRESCPWKEKAENMSRVLVGEFFIWSLQKCSFSRFGKSLNMVRNMGVCKAKFG